MNLSIKNVPEDLVRRLKERAKANHRSLQGEMLSIIEAALGDRGILTIADGRRAELRWIDTPMPGDATVPRAGRDPR